MKKIINWFKSLFTTESNCECDSFVEFNKLQKLIKERNRITEKTIKENKVKDEEYVENGQKILKLINENFNKFDVDLILEALTHLGMAPCVVYDDDGYWAIDDEGMSNIREEDGDFEYSTYVPGKRFKPTIREALKFYLDEIWNS